MSINDLKHRLFDVPGIETLTLTNIGGRSCYQFNGKIAAVDPSATDQEIEDAIRKAAAMTVEPAPAPAPVQPKATTMNNPVPGGFAAGLKAMMAEAKAGLEQTRSEGTAKVKEAVAKLNDAKTATAHVADTMAKTIAGEADDVLAELGQISNDLGLSS